MSGQNETKPRTLLVKSLRALASWEKGDVDEICRIDFSRGGQLKLDVSVYEVAEADIVRVAAEHLAAAPMFPNSVNVVDVTGILKHAKPTDPGDRGFQFLRTSHRNEDLPDEQAVRTFVDKLLAEFQTRVRRVEKATIRAYVRAQKQAGDPEWLAYFKNNAQAGRQWEKL